MTQPIEMTFRLKDIKFIVDTYIQEKMDPKSFTHFRYQPVATRILLECPFMNPEHLGHTMVYVVTWAEQFNGKEDDIIAAYRKGALMTELFEQIKHTSFFADMIQSPDVFEVTEDPITGQRTVQVKGLH